MMFFLILYILDEYIFVAIRIGKCGYPSCQPEKCLNIPLSLMKSELASLISFTSGANATEG